MNSSVLAEIDLSVHSDIFCHIYQVFLLFWIQRFVSSIENIEKAMWVFNFLGRLGWFGE